MKKIITTVILMLLLITLSISTVLLALLHFGTADDRELSGEWTAELDMTQEAAIAALGWLQDIEAVSVSLEDMESCMQDLSIEINLTMEQTSRAEGTFRCNVLPESYDACNQAAYEAFAGAFRELLMERLDMAGYTGSTDQEAVEALVTETFGMSTASYLMNYGPALLPSLEDMQDKYGGSGTYEAAEDVLTRRFNTGGIVATRAEHYIRKDSNLILTGEMDPASSDLLSNFEPVIYTLKQTSN